MALDFVDLPDENYTDGMIRIKGINLLEQLAKESEPFFLAIGFKKPHEPFIAPKKYWNLYKYTKFAVAANQKAPKGREKLRKHILNGKDVQANIDPETGLINEDFQLQLKQGYYASTSFIDAQVG